MPTQWHFAAIDTAVHSTTISYNPVSRTKATSQSQSETAAPDIYDGTLRYRNRGGSASRQKRRTEAALTRGSAPMRGEQEHSGITGCRVTYESTDFYNEANQILHHRCQNVVTHSAAGLHGGRYFPATKLCCALRRWYELPRTRRWSWNWTASGSRAVRLSRLQSPEQWRGNRSADSGRSAGIKPRKVMAESYRMAALCLFSKGQNNGYII